MFFKQRVPQPLGARGSLKWIQRLLTNHPELLTNALRASINPSPDWSVEWVSPRRDDEWAEYRDAGFLIQLGLQSHVDALQAFWPAGGPQWDALGRSSSGDVILVEAKAHTNELTSTCGAGDASREVIDRAFGKTKAAMNIDSAADWASGYYQYANRLAHLHFLRSQGVKAWLVFLYFYGDAEMKGPESADAWREQLVEVKRHLGVSEEVAVPGVIDAFIPVQVLQHEAA